MRNRTSMDAKAAWAASLGAAFCLAGCASGQGSFLAGSGGQSAVASSDAELLGFENAAPNLLAASGNALLPGSRSPAAATLLDQPQLGRGAGLNAAVTAPGLGVGASLASPATASLALSGSPLMGLGGAGLLGASAGTRLGVMPGASVSTGLGATTQGVAPSLISGLGGGAPATTGPTVSRVPGAQPLQTLLTGLRPPGS